MADPAASRLPETLGLPRVLVVDDARATSDVAPRFVDALREEGYEVAVAAGATDCLNQLANPPAVVILCSLRPGMQWTELCRQIRAVVDVPILMGVRLQSEVDAVVAFELGVTAYLNHSNRTRELVARVRAALRPVTPFKSWRESEAAFTSDSAEVYTDGRLEIDLVGRVVRVTGHPVYLARREFDLLSALVSQPRHVRTREELIDMVWGRWQPQSSRTLDTHMARLRMKLEADPSNPRMLVTVRGVGFCFEPSMLRESPATSSSCS